MKYESINLRRINIMKYKEFCIQYALGTLNTSYKDTLYDITYSTKSKKILTILSKDKDDEVRYYVSRNPNTPIEVLKMLSHDEDTFVRWGVSVNKNYIKIKNRS
jgi:hypothetical protein